MTKSEPVMRSLEDAPLQPLALFAEQVVGIADGRTRAQNESIPDTVRRVTSQFQLSLPLLAYELLASSGILDISDSSLAKWKAEAKEEVRALVGEAASNISKSVDDAREGIRKTADEAVKDFENAKTEASKISVVNAQSQFQAAADALRTKATVWSLLTALIFSGLAALLIWLLLNPPPLIQDIVDALKPGSKDTALPVSVPLLVVASAYFTSIRLAIVGVLGVGLAFSLRMTRAYFHMIEHNEHKLRVTNSIEAFVAAVRTNEQKDRVLSKLVESVTEFGDSGILGNEEKPPSMPSVIFETMTKNFGKPD
jgi:hypothetical protein